VFGKKNTFIMPPNTAWVDMWDASPRAIYLHLAKRDLKFSLVPSRIHARTQPLLREHKPFDGKQHLSNGEISEGA
jgi:hypothetical protein